ncbi:phosphoribosyltransferase [Pseudomonas sp. UBA1879]|uniref:phosphoribosyltransferase n=1 Tax=Pseudomonas sp. UBA1879 TaxID=1947305 RepID=UPI0025FF895D|nr:phosphoribosyltransferase [Pseudomonas sp. UBA1879]
MIDDSAERLGRPLIEVSYQKLDQWISSLQVHLRAECFQRIVGVLRGGGPLALMVSHVTGVEVGFLRYERSTRTVAWDSSLPMPDAGSKVLLCEDIAGAGFTLIDCVRFLERQGIVVQTLTGAYDDLSRIRPHYALDSRGYYSIFPWERQAFTDAYRTQWQEALVGSRVNVDPDHTFAYYGIDLDGVLVPDVPLHVYEECLESALAERDGLLPYDVTPALNNIVAIITGRPEMDRQRTQRWLNSHGFAGLKLVMRDPSIFSDAPADVARFKATHARQLGCTHYVESDPVQALHIARTFPLLHTIWWNAETKEGHWVSAQSWSG